MFLIDSNKVDTFVADQTLSANYKPVSVEKIGNVDGKYAVEERYIENGTDTGRDIYIFNGTDFYQFVTKIKTDLVDQYQSAANDIVNSLKISNE